MQRVADRLKLVVPATLAIIVLLLYFAFRNFGSVLLILGTLPLALVGGVWLLWGLEYNLSVAVAAGFIALAGVAVEIGVLMVLYLDQALKEARSNGPLDPVKLRQAVVEGALLRIRPILMTVTATIVGLLPIMFGSGTGSEVMRRIAAPMVGGMVSVTVLALAVVPVVYFLWKRAELGRETVEQE
jgi:Cu(I)/Ag(I) efflux system membrane protein CusA/SilA